MNLPVPSLIVAAAWFAITAPSPAQNVEPATPSPSPALVTIPLPHRDDKAAGTIPAEDGLLREGLNESSHPQAAPILVIKPASTPAPRSRRPVASRRTRVEHPVARPANTQSTVVPTIVKRRAPVVSFVYWWNGWVIRTFHTKIGTVMLGTIGAKA